MNIDLHVHTSERSPCAGSSEKDQIEKAISSGLEAIAITDHHVLVNQNHLAELNRQYPQIKILCGIEITADGEDWLVLGKNDPHLEKGNWSYPELHTYVRAIDGILVLAHPFRYHSDITASLDSFRPDAIEGRSINIHDALIPRIRYLAQRLQLPTLCNSDAHHTSGLGKYYNILHKPAQNEAEILGAIKAGNLFHSV